MTIILGEEKIGMKLEPRTDEYITVGVYDVSNNNQLLFHMKFKDENALLMHIAYLQAIKRSLFLDSLLEGNVNKSLLEGKNGKQKKKRP